MAGTFIRNRLLPRVAVGLSGGVDSSVAALLLLEQGYEVIGVHMQNWDTTDEAGASACPYTEDLRDAEAVSKQLGIPFHRVDFCRPYWTHVFTPFLEEYDKGLTPNPDILCNREIKFDRFQGFARDVVGTPWIATGHYARLRHFPSLGPSLPVGPLPSSTSEGGPRNARACTGSHSSLPELCTGMDEAKDQSYFLSQVPTRAFQHVLFPLGHLRKGQVRDMAHAAGLCTAEKKESMGICFVGKRRMGAFLPEYLQPRAGTFVSVTTGEVLGTQEGALTLLTVGQGARIGGAEEKWFVCGKDMEAGRIYVAPGTDHPALYCDWLLVAKEDFNWIGQAPWEMGKKHEDRSQPTDRLPSTASPSVAFRCEYRARYRQPLAGCQVSTSSDHPGMLRVDFDVPQRGVALSQTLALYAGERCLGGGAIVEVGPSYYAQGKRLPEKRLTWAVSGGKRCVAEARGGEESPRA